VESKEVTKELTYNIIDIRGRFVVIQNCQLGCMLENLSTQLNVADVVIKECLARRVFTITP